LGPPDHGIPKKVDATNQAQNAQHVLARCRSHEHGGANPKIILLSHLRIVLDKQNRHWYQQIAKTSKKRANRLQWSTVSEYHKNHEIGAKITKPTLEGDEGKVGPEDAHQSEKKKGRQEKVVREEMPPTERPGYQDTDR